jgi:hypothetical protein
MALQSQHFRGDPKLEAAAVSDPAHIVQGASGEHVLKIQQALKQLDSAAIDLDGKYGPGTARAVSAFKQKRNILNFQGKIDDIVGKKTMAALDGEMLAKEKAGGGGGGRLLVATKISPLLGQVVNITPKFLDIVVRFRGGASRDALANLGSLAPYEGKGNLVLRGVDLNNTAELIDKVVKNNGNRALLPISRDAVDPNNSANLIRQVLNIIDVLLSNPLLQPGIICINGNSAGARNALQLAAALKGKRAIKFLGLADAALFANLPGMNKPKTPRVAPLARGEALNFPHWGSPPSFDAEVKQNFFQNADNNFTFANKSISAQWTGNIIKRDGEIHGLISGFPGPPDPGDPANFGGVEIDVPITKRPVGAHDHAGDEGDIRNGAKITELLTALP